MLTGWDTVLVTHELFAAHALEVAPQLLGSTLSVTADDRTAESADGRAGATATTATVTIRITEVEAYHGVGVPGPYDAGSHSRSRRTERNASMFGPPGHAYVYLSHGIHFAINFVCSPEGVASGVLIRAGEVIGGHELAQARRTAKRGGTPVAEHLLARGPGNLAQALGITRPAHDGLDLFAHPFSFAPAPHIDDALPGALASGPRVGVSGEAGGPAFPWRFWIAGDPTVSAYRPGKNVPKS